MSRLSVRKDIATWLTYDSAKCLSAKSNEKSVRDHAGKNFVWNLCLLCQTRIDDEVNQIPK